MYICMISISKGDVFMHTCDVARNPTCMYDIRDPGTLVLHLVTQDVGHVPFNSILLTFLR